MLSGDPDDHWKSSKDSKTCRLAGLEVFRMLALLLIHNAMTCKALSQSRLLLQGVFEVNRKRINLLNSVPMGGLQGMAPTGRKLNLLFPGALCVLATKDLSRQGDGSRGGAAHQRPLSSSCFCTPHKAAHRGYELAHLKLNCQTALTESARSHVLPQSVQ